jgi:hypothetical protein
MVHHIKKTKKVQQEFSEDNFYNSNSSSLHQGLNQVHQKNVDEEFAAQASSASQH